MGWIIDYIFLSILLIDFLSLLFLKYEEKVKLEKTKKTKA